MLSGLKTLLSKHLSQHLSLYFVVLLCFTIGIASGVFTVKALGGVQKDQLIDYLVSSFKATLINGQMDNNQIFWYSATNSLKTTLLIWAFSICIIAFPLVFLVIGIRGFVLGFTVGFLIENLGYKGILFSIVSILPQNIIIIPALITLCVISVRFSTTVIKNRRNKRYIKKENFRIFLKYTIVCVILFIALLVGSIIEGYVSPVFLKGISGFLLK